MFHVIDTTMVNSFIMFKAHMTHHSKELEVMLHLKFYVISVRSFILWRKTLWRQGCDKTTGRTKPYTNGTSAKSWRGQNFWQLFLMWMRNLSFCGICVHGFLFLLVMRKVGDSLLTTLAEWWSALLGCIFCGVGASPQKFWWMSINLWSSCWR
jgi:hypothetical protein